MIQNDLLHEFIDKAIISFCNRFQPCVAATGRHGHWEQYRVSYRHLTFMIETYELFMKSCKNLTCYSCIFNVQLHVHLKKWTLKFKPLHLRNYASYFNKICRLSCVNTHIKLKSLKVCLISILPWLKYSIFSRGLFLIGTPCRLTRCQSLFVDRHWSTVLVISVCGVSFDADSSLSTWVVAQKSTCWIWSIPRFTGATAISHTTARLNN